MRIQEVTKIIRNGVVSNHLTTLEGAGGGKRVGI